MEETSEPVEAKAHDPIVSAYPAFLKKDMAANPGALTTFTSAERDELTTRYQGRDVSDGDVSLEDDVTF